MTRRPFDRSELGESSGHDRIVSDLGRYADLSAREVPPHDFTEQVMSAVEAEVPPRRGLMTWLMGTPGSGGGLDRLARATALSAALALAIAGVLFAGQLGRVLHDFQYGTGPSPTVIESPQPSPSVSSPSPAETPTESEPSGGTSESPEASPLPAGSDEHGGSSANDGGSGQETQTQRPSPTATESPSPKQSQTPEETASPTQGS
jgi:hypothetical protein